MGLAEANRHRHRLRVIEAALWLGAARLALALVPFPQLMGLLTRPPRRAELSGAARAQARQAVRAAILAVWRRAPALTTCLHRAMAAQLMLRRRGVSTTLYYGAAVTPARGLEIHAWLQDGVEGVIGLEPTRHQRFQTIACYAPARPDQ